MSNSTDTPDWSRLEKALTVEADTGFTDIQGRQYCFSEFLSISFNQIPVSLHPSLRRQWQETAQDFERYGELTLPQKKDLVSETKHLLTQAQKTWSNTTPVVVQLPQTTPVASSSLKNSITLQDSLSQLPGIGFTQGKQLQSLGLSTIRDLLFYYPRDHMDYARQIKIAFLVEGETVTIIGNVKRCNCFVSPKNKKLTILELLINDGTGQIKINRFYAGNQFANMGWQNKLKNQYPVGAIIAASGLVKKNKYGITLDNPELEVLDSAGSQIESLKIGRILPVYPLSEGVPADLVRKAVLGALSTINQVVDPLPMALRNQYGLIGLSEAIANIHFPSNFEIIAHARRRLVFDEFFWLQLGFLQRRQQHKETHTSPIVTPSGQLIDEFNKILPFSLTNAQKRVIGEILEDLESTTPMNRLVQGDVGSGKTIVAVFSILAAIQSGYQGALMAPTEVLAEQHYRKIVGWFNLLHLRVELLTGSTKVAKRREIHTLLETGQLSLLVGTHALIQDPVNFHKLGLVVIDEQHRFGVQQRARLLAKGQSPHVLTMTATPIPRTLSLTLHGDLDVSQIDELPPGRQGITTTVLTGRQRTQAYDLIRREVAKGRQAYIILAMIEESDKMDLRAAVEEHEKLSELVFPEFNVGLLHGRMSSAEKEESLKAFRDNEAQIIVSTTVIEVGVDVPNATVMLIENAERFGLSQLHQLRGRVGRGVDKSYCLLLTTSNAPEARQRLAVLENSQDGFFISEMDLRFRGPGQVLGTRQSGLGDFALASLLEDEEVLTLAREAAEKIILADPSLEEMPYLRQELARRLEKMLSAEILT